MAWAKIASQTGVAGGQFGTATNAGMDTTGASTLFMITCDYNVDPSTDTVSDSKGNSWHHLASKQNAGDNGTTIWYAFDHGGSPLVVGTGHTASASGGYTLMLFSAFSGGQLADPYDGSQNGAFTAGSTMQPGSITPAVDNCLVITGFVLPNVGGAVVNAISGGFTLDSSVGFASGSNVGGGFGFLIQGSVAAANPTWTASTTGFIASTIAAFRPAVPSTDAPFRPDTSIPQGYILTVVNQ